MPKTKPEDANLHMNLIHDRAHAIAMHCRVLGLAMIGAQHEGENAGDVTGDVEHVMREIEQEATIIAEMIEALPGYRTLLASEYRGRYRINWEPAPCA